MPPMSTTHVLSGGNPAMRMQNDLDFDGDNDQRTVLVVHDTMPPFLDGRVRFTKQADLVLPLKDASSDMAVISRNGSALVGAPPRPPPSGAGHLAASRRRALSTDSLIASFCIIASFSIRTTIFLIITSFRLSSRQAHECSCYLLVYNHISSVVPVQRGTAVHAFHLSLPSIVSLQQQLLQCVHPRRCR